VLTVTLKKQLAVFQKQLGVSPKTARRFQKTPRCFGSNTTLFCLEHHGVWGRLSQCFASDTEVSEGEECGVFFGSMQ
jgi:hypothetical protein